MRVTFLTTIRLIKPLSIVFLSTLLLGCSGIPGSAPDCDRLLLFVSEATGDSRVNILDMDTGAVSDLTSDFYVAHQPILHPNSDRWAYADDYAPAWSPDGSRIAFISNRYGGEALFIMKANGSAIDRIDLDGVWIRPPDWSGVTNQLIFANGEDDHIYTVNPDGSNLTQLTHSNTQDSDPDWSPDGQKIAFSTGLDGDYDIAVMDLSNNEIQMITDNSNWNAAPDWSPKGERIAYTSNQDGDFEIFIVNADGSNPVQLTTNKAADFNPAWSPRGDKIAFESNLDGDLEIYVIDLNTLTITQLTDNHFDDYQVAWGTYNECQ
jgi:Tol biopolymer transport system component